jgi:16S rRNA (uracil1498-N3)-methyltransferase
MPGCIGFCANLDPGDESVALPREEGEHLTRVLRMGVGDTVSVFDGRGNEYSARVASVIRRDVRVSLLSRVEPAAEPSVALTLAQAVIKGAKMDDIVRDAVMPASRRTAARDRADGIDRRRADQRQPHRPLAARRVGVGEASKRAVLPEVRRPLTLEAFLQIRTQR